MEKKHTQILRSISGYLRKYLDTPQKSRIPLSFSKISVNLLCLSRRGPGLSGAVARACQLWAASRRNLSILLVLGLGVGITLSGFLATRDHYFAERDRAFEKPAMDYAAAFSSTIAQHLGFIGHSGAYFTSSNEVERWEFLGFTEKSLPRYPGIRALYWVPQVLAGERRRFEARARADGLYGFRFREAGADGDLVPAARRDRHYPIYFIEPFTGNEPDLGFDLASAPSLLAILQQAADEGRMVAEAQFVLPSHAGGSGELMLILPTYEAGKVPDSAEARRDKLIGFMVALLDVADMIEAAAQELAAPPWLDLYVLDTTDAAEARLLQFRSSVLQAAPPAATDTGQIFEGMFAASALQVADRRWTIVVKPTTDYADDALQAVPWAVGVVGTMLTIVLLQHLVAARNRTREIERSVAVRTAELSAANAALELEVAERKAAERQAQAARDQAELANRSKSEFLAMVSHELRTPLNAVIGFSELMANETYGSLGHDKYREYAADIRHSGTHLLSLINDILDLSKVEANEMTLSPEAVNLSATIDGLLRIMREKIKSAGLDVIVELASDLPPLLVDARALKQVLLNLISNAVKFTEPGGRVVITATLLPGGGIVITVADTGIGIAESDLALVLQPFSQADSSLSRKYEGTGLGLPLSKRLVELHGGRLTLRSKLRKGTAVSIKLPQSCVHHAQAEVA